MGANVYGVTISVWSMHGIWMDCTYEWMVIDTMFIGCGGFWLSLQMSGCSGTCKWLIRQPCRICGGRSPPQLASVDCQEVLSCGLNHERSDIP